MASKSRANTGQKRKRGGGVKKDDKEQSERFIETARKLESDEGGEKFKRAFRKIALHKKQKKRD